jgi:hypothetical protein
MPGFALDASSIRRIRAMLRWYEGKPQNELDMPGRTDRQQVVRRAIVTTAITAASGTNLVNAGSGEAILQQRDAAGVYSTMEGPSGDVIVKVWNGYSGTVAVGKVIYVFRSGDDWELISADCP